MNLKYIGTNVSMDVLKVGGRLDGWGEKEKYPTTTDCYIWSQIYLSLLNRNNGKKMHEIKKTANEVILISYEAVSVDEKVIIQYFFKVL